MTPQPAVRAAGGRTELAESGLWPGHWPLPLQALIRWAKLGVPPDSDVRLRTGCPGWWPADVTPRAIGFKGLRSSAGRIYMVPEPQGWPPAGPERGQPVGGPGAHSLLGRGPRLSCCPGPPSAPGFGGHGRVTFVLYGSHHGGRPGASQGRGPEPFLLVTAEVHREVNLDDYLSCWRCRPQTSAVSTSWPTRTLWPHLRDDPQILSILQLPTGLSWDPELFHIIVRRNHRNNSDNNSATVPDRGTPGKTVFSKLLS